LTVSDALSYLIPCLSLLNILDLFVMWVA